MNDVFNDSLVLSLNGPAERTDDSRRERALQAVRIADRQDLLPNLKSFRCSQRDGCHSPASPIDLNNRKIVVRIGANNLRVVFALIRQGDFEVLGATDDVEVRDDVALIVDDCARSGTGFHRHRAQEKVVANRGGRDVHDTRAVALVNVDIVPLFFTQSAGSRRHCRAYRGRRPTDVWWP